MKLCLPHGATWRRISSPRSTPAWRLCKPKGGILSAWMKARPICRPPRILSIRWSGVATRPDTHSYQPHRGPPRCARPGRLIYQSQYRGRAGPRDRDHAAAGLKRRHLSPEPGLARAGRLASGAGPRLYHLYPRRAVRRRRSASFPVAARSWVTCPIWRPSRRMSLPSQADVAELPEQSHRRHRHAGILRAGRGAGPPIRLLAVPRRRLYAGQL